MAPPLPPPGGRLSVQLVLLALTFISTTFTGACHYANFSIDLSTAGNISGETASRLFDLSDPRFYARGLWYSLTILAILGCHEMGHYIACLRYGIDATRPYFLPAPLLTGTLGAFIRIRSRFPNRIALFDVGIAGPIAGFVVAVPALFAGLLMSRIDRMPEDTSSLVELGEPLLFQFAAWLIWGDVGDGFSINMHPVAFAAWFGLLATALNLFPVAQLDGGHISYAVLRRRSTLISVAMIFVFVGLTFMSSSWVVWTLLLVAMIYLVGPHHPPTLDDDAPIGTGRVVLAVIAMVMLIVCFTPFPIGPFVPGTS